MIKVKAYLIGINSKYIHPAMGIFSLVANSNYPTIYDEFNIKDSKEKIITSILEKEYDLTLEKTPLTNISRSVSKSLNVEETNILMAVFMIITYLISLL